ncbi:hypothetical protein PGB90_001950 [Kerria lacca]
MTTAVIMLPMVTLIKIVIYNIVKGRVIYNEYFAVVDYCQFQVVNLLCNWTGSLVTDNLHPLLVTVLVRVSNFNQDHTTVARVLLDSGSQFQFISSQLIRNLDLKTVKSSYSIKSRSILLRENRPRLRDTKLGCCSSLDSKMKLAPFKLHLAQTTYIVKTLIPTKVDSKEVLAFSVKIPLKEDYRCSSLLVQLDSMGLFIENDN